MCSPRDGRWRTSASDARAIRGQPLPAARSRARDILREPAFARRPSVEVSLVFEPRDSSRSLTDEPASSNHQKAECVRRRRPTLYFAHWGTRSRRKAQLRIPCSIRPMSCSICRAPASAPSIVSGTRSPRARLGRPSHWSASSRPKTSTASAVTWTTRAIRSDSSRSACPAIGGIILSRAHA